MQRLFLLTALLMCLPTFTPLQPLGAEAVAETEPDLLFRASFDRLTAFADHARGKPECTLTESLELRAKPGVKGHCLLVQEGESCLYDAADNVDVTAGTISLWVRPVNWTDEDGRYVSFLNLFGRIKDSDKWFNLSIDKSDGKGVARAYCNFGSRNRHPDYKIYVALGGTKWDTETWHKLDATWDSKHIAIYVDGELSNRQDLPDVQFPELVSPKIELCREYPGAPEAVRSTKDRTYLDELEIFRGAQSADRIMERYLADRPDAGGELPVPLVTVPRVTGIELDGDLAGLGDLGKGEWGPASAVPILTDIRTGLPHGGVAWAFAGYDEQNLYLGLWTLQGWTKPVAKAGRDGQVWLDDAFEVFLSPGEEPNPHFFQFIVNSKGAWFDAKGGDGKWSASRLTARGRALDDDWSIELAIPFSDLGVPTPKPGEIWRANFCRDWYRPAPADPVYTTWSYGGPSYLDRPERFGKLVFGGPQDGAQVIVTPSLSSGRITVASSSAQEGALEVSVVDADGRRAFHETRTVLAHANVEGKVREVKLATLTATLSDPTTGATLNEYRTRFFVKQPISVEYVPDVPGRKLTMALDLTNLEPEWLARVKAGNCHLTITANGPKDDQAKTVVALPGGTTEAAVPFQFEEGAYDLTYTLQAPDTADPLVVEDSLTVPDLSWVGSRVGVSNEVLEPWTPLQYSGDRTVSCWGRRYEFAGPLPTKMVNQGRDMLRGPVALTMGTATGEAELAETSRRVVGRDPHRVEFAGTAAFEGIPAAVEWQSWIEYDGLVVSTFTLTPPDGGLDFESLTMRMPLRHGLRHIRGARKSPNRQEWDGKLWESHFEPFLWLTDEDEGFLYFCESEANWVYPNGKPVTVVRGGEEPSVELRLISQPTKLTKPITYQFGFQATPVKPMMPAWRELNFGPGLPIEHQTHQPWMNGYAYYTGLWEAPRPEEVRKLNDERREQGVLTFYYATTSCTANHNPTYRLFKPLWRDPYPAQFGPYEGKETRFVPAQPQHQLVPVCPGAPTFVEYELWLAKKLHEETGAMAFYTDTDGLWPCENRRHGCGFTDAFGKTGVTWTILKKRAFAKRLAALCRQLHRDGDRGYWMTHCHSKLVPPVHCFADFFWPGEEYTHRLYGNKWYYVNDMPEEDFRVQLSGKTSGLVHVFLPEFKRGTKDSTDVEQPQPTESLLAMCAVNDVNTSASYMHLPSMVEWWGIRKRLKLTEATFVPYWKDGCPVRAMTGNALASVYTWPGRATIAVANRGEKGGDVSVEVDLAALGLERGALEARDERTGRPAPLDGGRLIVPVKGRSYTFISLEARQ